MSTIAHAPKGLIPVEVVTREELDRVRVLLDALNMAGGEVSTAAKAIAASLRIDLTRVPLDLAFKENRELRISIQGQTFRARIYSMTMNSEPPDFLFSDDGVNVLVPRLHNQHRLTVEMWCQPEQE